MLETLLVIFLNFRMSRDREHSLFEGTYAITYHHRGIPNLKSLATH